MVNESGASIYSASEVAREEFPDHDITVRGAVSIGRRLMDPLAELVKLDAKSIGVGQYQHDVDQDALKQSLDDVVVSCVNAVGVEVEHGVQAAAHLRLRPERDDRREHRQATATSKGPFKSRRELLEVPRLGDKTFEQAAGFLRIRGARQPARRIGRPPGVLRRRRSHGEGPRRDRQGPVRDEALRKRIDKQKYVTDTVGLPTLNDILAELAKPGRDPREQFEAFQFAEGVNKLEDVKPGMKLPGIVTNVTAFGAFVDIGVHQDGLVHVSQLADRFVKDPNEVVKVQQRVEVTVLEVDLPRKRIALSMRRPPRSSNRVPRRKRKSSRSSRGPPGPQSPLHGPSLSRRRPRKGGSPPPSATQKSDEVPQSAKVASFPDLSTIPRRPILISDLAPTIPGIHGRKVLIRRSLNTSKPSSGGTSS